MEVQYEYIKLSLKRKKAEIGRLFVSYILLAHFKIKENNNNEMLLNHLHNNGLYDSNYKKINEMYYRI